MNKYFESSKHNYKSFLNQIKSQQQDDMKILKKILELDHEFKCFIDLQETLSQLQNHHNLLQFIAELALRGIQAVDQGLFKNYKNKVVLTKAEVAQILAMMFFCMTEQNFGKWYQKMACQQEKISCLVYYFDSLNEIGITELQKYYVTYEKLKYNQQDNITSQYLQNNQQKITQINIDNNNGIETNQNAIQIDFANEYVGGGILDYGCLQEEIRFSVSPELIPAIIFFPHINEYEAILMIGAERFVEYKGYADSFKVIKSFKDPVQTDKQQRKDVQVVAIDATMFDFKNDQKQYSEKFIMRDLIKSYVGFKGEIIDDKKEIATGKWGCGAFNGDPQLKLMIQIISASLVQKNMTFHSFQCPMFSLYEQIVSNLQDKTISYCWNILLQLIKEKQINSNSNILSILKSQT